MTQSAQTQSPAVKPMTLAELQAAVEALTMRMAKLEESSKSTNKSDREMTDADALRILTGDLKDLKHNEAAAKLGLSYGQVYSCRGEYTFRHVHKELAKNPGWKNPWKKA